MGVYATDRGFDAETMRYLGLLENYWKPSQVTGESLFPYSNDQERGVYRSTNPYLFRA